MDLDQLTDREGSGITVPLPRHIHDSLENRLIDETFTYIVELRKSLLHFLPLPAHKVDSFRVPILSLWNCH
jgi:hypothetical protein